MRSILKKQMKIAEARQTYSLYSLLISLFTKNPNLHDQYQVSNSRTEFYKCLYQHSTARAQHLPGSRSHGTPTIKCPQNTASLYQDYPQPRAKAQAEPFSPLSMLATYAFTTQLKKTTKFKKLPALNISPWSADCRPVISHSPRSL